MDSEIVIFAAIGFLAQIVDGALGMAFGVIASSSLIAFGAPPAVASAAVHAAEVFTTGVSGASHIWHRNIDWRLFLRLVLAGICGGALGAYVLTGLPEDIVKPLVTVYLTAMAALILVRLLGKSRRRWRPRTEIVGAGGGFLDAVGGGGWGPLVASTLIATGNEPRRSIGSVNLAEFFVTCAVSVTFLLRLDLGDYGRMVIGLIIGGAIAAPLAGYLVRILPARAVLLLVACILFTLSALNIWTIVR